MNAARWNKFAADLVYTLLMLGFGIVIGMILATPSDAEPYAASHWHLYLQVLDASDGHTISEKRVTKVPVGMAECTDMLLAAPEPHVRPDGTIVHMECRRVGSGPAMAKPKGPEVQT